eukprot:PhM_4_TR9825/c2_g1_i1/m.73396
MAHGLTLNMEQHMNAHAGTKLFPQAQAELLALYNENTALSRLRPQRATVAQVSALISSTAIPFTLPISMPDVCDTLRQLHYFDLMHSGEFPVLLVEWVGAKWEEVTLGDQIKLFETVRALPPSKEHLATGLENFGVHLFRALGARLQRTCGELVLPSDVKTLAWFISEHTCTPDENITTEVIGDIQQSLIKCVRRVFSSPKSGKRDAAVVPVLPGERTISALSALSVYISIRKQLKDKSAELEKIVQNQMRLLAISSPKDVLEALRTIRVSGVDAGFITALLEGLVVGLRERMSCAGASLKCDEARVGELADILKVEPELKKFFSEAGGDSAVRSNLNELHIILRDLLGQTGEQVKDDATLRVCLALTLLERCTNVTWLWSGSDEARLETHGNEGSTKKMKRKSKKLAKSESIAITSGEGEAPAVKYALGPLKTLSSLPSHHLLSTATRALTGLRDHPEVTTVLARSLMELADRLTEKDAVTVLSAMSTVKHQRHLSEEQISKLVTVACGPNVTPDDAVTALASAVDLGVMPPTKEIHRFSEAAAFELTQAGVMDCITVFRVFAANHGTIHLPVYTFVCDRIDTLKHQIHVPEVLSLLETLKSVNLRHDRLLGTLVARTLHLKEINLVDAEKALVLLQRFCSLGLGYFPVHLILSKHCTQKEREFCVFWF